MARLRGHFVQGKAVDLVMSERLVEIQTTLSDGTHSNIYLPFEAFYSLFISPYSNTYLHRYDKLVIAVGSSSSTHGVSGLENCFQLKTIGDAQSIRRRIMGAQITTS